MDARDTKGKDEASADKPSSSSQDQDTKRETVPKDKSLYTIKDVKIQGKVVFINASQNKKEPE